MDVRGPGVSLAVILEAFNGDRFVGSSDSEDWSVTLEGFRMASNEASGGIKRETVEVLHAMLELRPPHICQLLGGAIDDFVGTLFE